MNEEAAKRERFRRLTNSIERTIENAERLYDESFDLEFRASHATRYYLVTIAQEEVAKSFLLYLIRDQIIPNSISAQRAVRDHNCKHLMGIVIDYMIMHWDTIDELRGLIELDSQLGDDFPVSVGSALEIFRYEKIGRWEDRNWDWVEDQGYDQETQRVAEGKRDRRKQDALYVRVGSDGQVSSTPAVISQIEMSEEVERASRYIRFSKTLISSEEGGLCDTHRFKKILSAFELLFGSKNKQ